LILSSTEGEYFAVCAFTARQCIEITKKKIDSFFIAKDLSENYEKDGK